MSHIARHKIEQSGFSERRQKAAVGVDEVFDKPPEVPRIACLGIIELDNRKALLQLFTHAQACSVAVNKCQRQLTDPLVGIRSLRGFRSIVKNWLQLRNNLKSLISRFPEDDEDLLELESLFLFYPGLFGRHRDTSATRTSSESDGAERIA